MDKIKNDEVMLVEFAQQRMCYIERGDLQGALGLVRRTLDQNVFNTKQARAKLLSDQGFLQADFKRFKEAFKSFQQASELFKLEKDPVGMATQIGNMGSVYRDQGDYAKALEFYQEAAGILREQNNKPGIAAQFSNIAYAYSQAQNIEAAVTYFYKAEEIYSILGEVEKASQCRYNITTLESNV